MMRIANEHGFAELHTLPGCTQIVVSNVAFVYPKFRGMGLGTRNHNLRIERAKLLGYDYFLCTVVETNKAERAILKKSGFKILDEFKSTKTGNTVMLYGKVITNEPTRDTSLKYCGCEDWECSPASHPKCFCKNQDTRTEDAN